MSYSTEFQKQWKKVCNFLESEMIRSGKQSGVSQADKLLRLLENEKKRWHVMSEYNNAWLEKLRRENAGVAERFEKELEAVKLQQIQPASRPSVLLLAAMPAAIAALIGFGVPVLLSASLKWILISGVSATLIAGYVGVNLYIRGKDRAAAADRKAYVSQLTDAEARLTAILDRVE